MNKAQLRYMDSTLPTRWEIVNGTGKVLLTIEGHYHDGAYYGTWPDGARAVLMPEDMPDGKLRCPSALDTVRLLALKVGARS